MIVPLCWLGSDSGYQHYHLFTLYFCEVQPSPGTATDTCCGQSSVRARCVINSEVNGVEQGTAILFFLFVDSDLQTCEVKQHNQSALM